MSHLNNYNLEIASTPHNVSLVGPYLDNVLGGCCVHEDLYGNMLLAVTEAVANAIIHGNGATEEKVVRVSSVREEHRLQIRVEDEGRGFDPNNIPDPTIPENLLKPGGRGVYLMRQLCDCVNFESKGSVVNMTFTI